jgi:hypothetical protein
LKVVLQRICLLFVWKKAKKKEREKGKAVYLVEFGGEQVQGSDDGAVGSQVVLFHDFFVVDGVSNINVCSVSEVGDCGVEVKCVKWFLFGVQFQVQPLHQRGLATSLLAQTRK